MTVAAADSPDKCHKLRATLCPLSSFSFCLVFFFCATFCFCFFFFCYCLLSFSPLLLSPRYKEETSKHIGSRNLLRDPRAAQERPRRRPQEFPNNSRDHRVPRRYACLEQPERGTSLQGGGGVRPRGVLDPPPPAQHGTACCKTPAIPFDKYEH